MPRRFIERNIVTITKLLTDAALPFVLLAAVAVSLVLLVWDWVFAGEY